MKKNLDYQINIYIVLLCIISCFFIYSSSLKSGQYDGAINFVYKQIFYYILGFAVMILISKLDFVQLKNFSLLVYIVIILLLIGLIFAPESIARPINDAKAWYQIPFIGSLQPSEFLKFSFLILTSWIIVTHNKKYNVHKLKTDFILLCKIALLTLPPMLLVYIQPDTGMIMLYISMLLPMLFFSGIQKKILFFILSVPAYYS